LAFFCNINNEDTDFFVLVKLIDHLHETGSNDGLQYVITEGKRFKPIFTLQSMKENGGQSSELLQKG
jgi:geranylgeranyl pyrophosphate synthase